MADQAAGPTPDPTVESFVTVTLESEFLQLQPNLGLDYVVGIALVRSDHVAQPHRLASTLPYSKKNHERIRFLKRKCEARRKAGKQV